MEGQLQVNYNKERCYDIIFKDSYEQLGKEIDKLNLRNRKICVVCDSNTQIYLEEVMNQCKEYVSVVDSYTFSAGEENKTLDTVKNLYKHLIEAKFDRNDVLFALGGGVVGDLVGYTAATYLRGIRFIQLPTTLLSMVDSSVGGKTGVDFDAYKNMVGAFHQPKCVYMNLSTLKSLPKEQYSSGLAEVVKYGFIKKKDFYEWLKENTDRIMNMDIESIHKMVFESCLSKKEVVEEDPLEQGERALLNFGHTIGHAVEKLMDFTLFHGQCVAIGMVAALYLSYKRGYLSLEDLNSSIKVIKNFALPVAIGKLEAKDIVAATKNDKKMEAGKIKFILLHSIGNAFIAKDVTDEEMIDAIEYCKSLV